MSSLKGAYNEKEFQWKLTKIRSKLHVYMVLKEVRDTFLSFSLIPGAHNGLLLTHVIENHLPLAYSWTSILSTLHCDVRLYFWVNINHNFFLTQNRLPSLRSKRLKKTKRNTWIDRIAWLLFFYDSQHLTAVSLAHFHNFVIEFPNSTVSTVSLKESWFVNLHVLFEIFEQFHIFFYSFFVGFPLIDIGF